MFIGAVPQSPDDVAVGLSRGDRLIQRRAEARNTKRACFQRESLARTTMTKTRMRGAYLAAGSRRVFRKANE